MTARWFRSRLTRIDVRARFEYSFRQSWLYAELPVTLTWDDAGSEWTIVVEDMPKGDAEAARALREVRQLWHRYPQRGELATGER